MARFFYFAQKKRGRVLVSQRMGSHTGTARVGRGVSRRRKKRPPLFNRLNQIGFLKIQKLRGGPPPPENRLYLKFTFPLSTKYFREIL